MKKMILISIACAYLVSCASIPRDVRKSFTYCFDGVYTGLDTLIDIDRCYNKDWSYNGVMMFYDNGLVVYEGHFGFSHDGVYFHKNAALFLEGITGDDGINGLKNFYNNAYCGRYVIFGDTIKVQMLHKNTSLADDGDGYEHWYKIAGRDSLLYLYYSPLTTNLKKKESFEEYYGRFWSHEVKSVPVPVKPQPDNYWIFKKKWFWCNEQDWKAYMGRMK